MKQLLLIRHAKSAWDNLSLGDFERPLNERGKKDAPVMAERLVDKKINIDVFISSPAKRAKKTAAIFAKAFETDKSDILLKQELYGAEPGVFYNVISAVKNKYDSIAIFSHNPGITDFANELTETRIDNIPTCGIFAVEADCEKWEDFKMAKKKFLFFDSPRGGLD
jgi:phosphohistidine phosphatase